MNKIYLKISRSHYRHQDGFIVGSLLVLMLIMTILLLTITSAAVGNYQSAKSENARVNAQLAADAGLDVGIHEVNLDDTWVGIVETDLLNTTDIRTTYAIVVTDDGTGIAKAIRSTGRSYVPGSATTPKSTRTFELQIEAVTSGTGPGSVVSGVGGLFLNNNSKITGGDVIVNGSVTVNNGAQIGLSTNPINLRVAHQSCPSPVNSTYPQVCTTGQPITNSGLIYADVQAQNQTNGSGMSSPGLTSSTFAPIAVPGYDRAGHKARVTVGNTYAPNVSPIRCVGGVANWPADVKITGNVSLSNNCVITVNGNVWITGNLAFGNNSTIVVANTLTLPVGATRPVIMVDGVAGMNTGNNSIIQPNLTGIGAEVVTMWWNTNTLTNGGFNCGGIADLLDCTAVTGLALSTSQATTTINLSNNTNAANTIFRTLWTRVVVSNNGVLGAVAGQTIQLGNNAVINFTAAITGSDNLVTTWVKRGYFRVYD